VSAVLWWAFIAFVAVSLLLLFGLLRWALTGPDIDRDIAKDRFQSEQDWRSLRRSGKL
jgi:hypothetical protein